jgi:serine phosphatase RsbU (regulator of sigma subunit)
VHVNGHRILVVDDDAGIRHAVKRFLTRRGHAVETAPDGPDALELLAEFSPEILVADLSMPKMGGIELIRRVHALRPDVVPIVLTGMATRESAIAALREGVFDFIEKPLPEPGALEVAVERAGKYVEMVTDRRRLMNDLQTQNTVLRADLARAQLIQQHMLPRALRPLGDIGFCGYYRPCELLGGDFFDSVRLDDATSAVCVADVSGHGVTAALVTVVLRELLRAESKRENRGALRNPGETLALLNRGLCEEEFGVFVHATMGYAVIDAKARTVRYGSAGHPAPLLMADGSVRPLDCKNGAALGIDPDSTYAEVSTELTPGAALLLYTDGLTEARNRGGHELGVEAVSARLSNVPCTDALQVSATVASLLDAHLDHVAPGDDVCYLTVYAGEASVESVEPEERVQVIAGQESSGREPVPKAHIAAGSERGTFVVRLVGTLTWRFGATFFSAMDEAHKAGVERVLLDLASCDSMDSTILGIVCREGQGLTLSRPTEHLVGQMREVGIYHRLRVINEPPPSVPLHVLQLSPPVPGERKRILLDAHEQLMNLDSANRRRFAAVVELLREDVAAQAAM